MTVDFKTRTVEYVDADDARAGIAQKKDLMNSVAAYRALFERHENRRSVHRHNIRSQKGNLCGLLVALLTIFFFALLINT